MGIRNPFTRKSDAPEEEWDVEPVPFAETPAPVTGPLLTSAHVEQVRFHTAKPGYAFAQVEAFVDQVATTLRALQSEQHDTNTALREALADVDQLTDQVRDLQATIEVFRAKGDVLVNAHGEYVTESQLASLQSVTTERDALTVQVQQLTEDLQAYADAYAALQDAATEPGLVDTLNTQIADLQQALAQEQADRDAAAQAHADQIAVLTAERDTALAATPDETLAHELASARDEITALTGERDAAVQALTTLTSERDAALAAVAEPDPATLEELAQAKAVIKELQARNSELLTEGLTALSDLSKAREDLAAAANPDLTVGLDALRDQITALTGERDAAVQALTTLTSERDAALAAVAEPDPATLEELAQAKEDLAVTRAQNMDLRTQVEAKEAELAEVRAAAADAMSNLEAQIPSENVVAELNRLRSEHATLTAERDEAVTAEAELREYVDTVLADWQANATGDTPEPLVSEVTGPEQPIAPEANPTPAPGGFTSDDEDAGWGDDVPSATSYTPQDGTPETPNAGAAHSTGDEPAAPPRRKASLIDAPEVRGQN